MISYFKVWMHTVHAMDVLVRSSYMSPVLRTQVQTRATTTLPQQHILPGRQTV